MVKAPLPIEAIMGDPGLSISTSPFAPGKLIIKRASFRAGQIPEHLRGYLIKSGECIGIKGTVVYKGKPIPKVAACVAAKHGR